MKVETKEQRIVRYKKLINEIKRKPTDPFYLCVDLGIETGDFKSPELDLFRPSNEEWKPEMEDCGWFGRGLDNPDNHETRIFVLTMMIEMIK
jgi:hypothetical protein